jgi:hypothetical protein
LLDVVDVATPPSFLGMSLIDPFPGSPVALPRHAFGTSTHTGARYVRTNELKLLTPWVEPPEAVVATHLRPSQEWSPIERIDAGEQLFDLLRDPSESANLIGDPARLADVDASRRSAESHAELIAELRRMLSEAEGIPAMSAEQIRRLRALGYLRDAP